MPAAKATLNTLAQATGLSLATVSRALAGSDQVLPATRERVERAARQQRYVRDRAAVRLKTGKTQVLAFLMDRFDAMNPGFRDLLLGVGDAVQGTDYHLIVLPSPPDGDPLAPLRYVVERGLADGLVLSHTTPQDARVRYLQARRFPFVTHGRTELRRAHAYVDFANERFAARAVQALAARGRRHLAMLLPLEGAVFRGHLEQGFLEACAGARIRGQCITSITMDDSPERIYRWGGQHARRFDGLVVSREAPTLPLLSAIADAGGQVGQDIDVAIKYSSSLPRYIRQPLLACFEDLHEAGLTLGRNLIAQCLHPGLPPQQVLFDPPPLERFAPHD